MERTRLTGLGSGGSKWTTHGSEPHLSKSREGDEEGGVQPPPAPRLPSTALLGQMSESKTVIPVSEGVGDKNTRLEPVHAHTCSPVCVRMCVCVCIRTHTHTAGHSS